MYSITASAPPRIPVRPFARPRYGSGMRPMEAMRRRIAAGTVASPLDSPAAHA